MRKDNSFLLFLVLVITSFILISIDSNNLKEMDFIKGEIRDIASVFSKSGSMTLRKLSLRFDRHLETLKAKDESIALKNQLQEMEQEIIELNEIKKGYERQKELQKLKEHIHSTRGIETIAGKIINAELTNWHKTLTVNKGKKDGVAPGNVVIVGKELENKLTGRIVGSISNAGTDTSIILLLTDQRSSIGGIIQRTRVHGIVKGSLSNWCTIDDISNTADIIEGDIILSSGLGELFPAGLQIGKVSFAEKRKNGFFQEIVVSPFVDISRIEEVTILKGKE